LAHSSRTWTGARSPQGKKRVRQAERRNAILQPRRSAAKTLVKSALVAAGTGESEQTQAAVILAVSALDRAAKVGAIHPNAAARRKSRLMLKVNASLAGAETVTTGKVARQTSKAASVKAAKARIAAGKATKAKGEQTAAGKARAALSKTTRQAAAAPVAAPVETPTKPTTGKAATTKAATTKAAATKAAPKAKASTTKAPAAKASTAKPKASATKTTTAKAAATKAAPKAKAPAKDS
jgi:ribosomal protein S20